MCVKEEAHNQGASMGFGSRSQTEDDMHQLMFSLIS